MALNDSDADLVRRAQAAWFRSGGIDQPSTTSYTTTHNGKQYVVLVNSYSTLAVYRYTNQGQLKKLRRWPLEVAER